VLPEKSFKKIISGFIVKTLKSVLLTFMSNPEGLSHSNRKMKIAAAWIATTPTNIQEAVSKGSENYYIN